MNKPLISIVIPVYNVELYLNTCLESICNQTYTNLEIILVDDESPDNCPTICDDWAKRDSRIKVIHRKNGRVAAARNSGIELAEGEFLFFVDSDDLIHPDMIRFMLEEAIKSESDIVACNLKPFYGMMGIEELLMDIENPLLSGTKKGILYNQKEIMQYLVNQGGEWLVGPCCKLYKRKVFRDIRFPEGQGFEDEYIIHHVLSNTNSFLYFDIPLYFYRRHEKSVMMNKRNIAEPDELLAYEDRISFLDKAYPEINIEKLLFKIIFLYQYMAKNGGLTLERKNEYRERARELYQSHKSQISKKGKIKVWICFWNVNLYDSVKNAVSRRG